MDNKSLFKQIIVFSFILLSALNFVACDAGGNFGGSSDSDNKSTDGIPVKPKNVQTIQGDGEVTVSWDLSEDADYYTLCLKEIGQDESFNEVYDMHTSDKYIFRNLNNGTKYSFGIIAVNSFGESKMAVVSVKPAMPNTGITSFDGKWEALFQNRYVDVVLENKVTMILEQTNNSITGTLEFIGELLNCCGPLSEKYEIVGDVVRDTAELYLTLVTPYDECSCSKNSLDYDLIVGEGNTIPDNFLEAKIYKNGKTYLIFENPECLFGEIFTDDCIQYFDKLEKTK